MGSNLTFQAIGNLAQAFNQGQKVQIEGFVFGSHLGLWLACFGRGYFQSAQVHDGTQIQVELLGCHRDQLTGGVWGFLTAGEVVQGGQIEKEASPGVPQERVQAFWVLRMKDIKNGAAAGERR